MTASSTPTVAMRARATPLILDRRGCRCRSTGGSPAGSGLALSSSTTHPQTVTSNCGLFQIRPKKLHCEFPRPACVLRVVGLRAVVVDERVSGSAVDVEGAFHACVVADRFLEVARFVRWREVVKLAEVPQHRRGDPGQVRDVAGERA